MSEVQTTGAELITTFSPGLNPMGTKISIYTALAYLEGSSTSTFLKPIRVHRLSGPAQATFTFLGPSGE